MSDMETDLRDRLGHSESQLSEMKDKCHALESTLETSAISTQ